jgi:hypothetical protein
MQAGPADRSARLRGGHVDGTTLDTEGNASAEAAGALKSFVDSLMALPASRRQVLVGGLVAAGALGAASCVNDVGNPFPTPPSVTYAAGSAISADDRLALRALWDAIVPGDWMGNEEDGGAPGADQAYVEAWLEQVAMAEIPSLGWLTADFLNFWGADINAWAQVTTLFQKDYAELPLGTSIIDPSTRQGKVILMMNLLVPGIETIFDLQYLGGIMLAKLAFFGDFWFEANDPTTMVGRAYIGAHLPPITTPYEPNSYNANLGMADSRLITVNGFTNLP